MSLFHCEKGKHKLVTVYSSDEHYQQNVVRWCEICGSVVVDTDYDGRTIPGNIMKMKTPLVTKTMQEWRD